MVNQLALGDMRNVIPFLAIVLIFVSCTNKVEVGTPFVEGQEVTLMASIVDSNSSAKQVPGKQRVSGKDAGAAIDLTWNAGDQILVSVGDKSAVFTLSSGENSSSGEFTGKMPADGSEYSVSYPVDYSDDVLTHQTYVENGFGNGLMKMSTRTNGTLEDGFVLSADNAVLGLQLTGNQTLGKIVLTDLASRATYTLNCEGVVLQEEVTLFYIVVPVKDWANGMRVEVYSEDGNIILMKEKAGEIMFSATDAMVMPSLEARGPGKRIGVFSVGEGKYVSFSQGNLQYIQSTKEWLFAENQWDFIGEKNIYSGVIADIIDFFGWSTNNPQSLWGLIFTQCNVYYSGTFVDLGNNLIMGNLAKTWRTLSLHEWTYLLRQRENANNLYTYANINGTNGLVLLPDKWEAIDEIPISIATDYSANTFSFSQWETLEAKGAVFLPSCGVYMGNNYNHETAGLYWTNTPDESDETKSHCLYVTKSYVNINYSGNRSTNRSVRLVHDTIVQKVEPEYVDLGLSVKWATCNIGATLPNEIGTFYAWGEIEPKDSYTVNNYQWWNKTSKEITKYCTIDSLAYGGVADGLTELQPQDDAAHMIKGEHWRMPDLDECKELVNGCTWTVTTRQGQIGFEGKSKSNGNTIFLPVAGFRAGTNLVYETLGGYWSSTLNIEKQSCARGLYLNQETPAVNIYYNSSRENGFLIRPVYDDRVE